MSDDERGPGSNGTNGSRVGAVPAHDTRVLSARAVEALAKLQQRAASIDGSAAQQSVASAAAQVDEQQVIDLTAVVNSFSRYDIGPKDPWAPSPVLDEAPDLPLAPPIGAPMTPPRPAAPTSVDAPSVDAPSVDVPSSDVPSSDAPSSDAPSVDLEDLLERHRRELAAALDRARADAARIVADARHEAVGIVADAIAEVREQPFLPATPPVNIALDPESFARCFAAAIAVVLEQQQAAASSGGDAARQQIIDLSVQPNGTGYRAFAPNMPWPVVVAPAQKRTFWSNAWHPDVILSVIAMSIVLIILIAFAA